VVGQNKWNIKDKDLCKPIYTKDTDLFYPKSNAEYYSRDTTEKIFINQEDNLD
jgi:hypothetical protein